MVASLDYFVGSNVHGITCEFVEDFWILQPFEV